MHLIGIAWIGANLITIIKFAFSRAATWTGVVYLFRRGKESGKKSYYVVGALIYVFSWALIILGSRTLWHFLYTHFHKQAVYHPIYHPARIP